MNNFKKRQGKNKLPNITALRKISKIMWFVISESVKESESRYINEKRGYCDKNKLF